MARPKKTAAKAAPAHVLALHQQIGEEEGTPTQANRLRSVVSQICTLAEQSLLRPIGSNPTRCIPPYHERRRTDHVPPHQRRPLLAACRRLVLERKIDVSAGALLQLMLLVGLRWSDARLLRWEEIRVNSRKAELHLLPRGPRKERSKGGERRIPLGQRAIDLLLSMPRHTVWWAPNPRTGVPYAVRRQYDRVDQQREQHRGGRMSQLKLSGGDLDITGGRLSEVRPGGAPFCSTSRCARAPRHPRQDRVHGAIHRPAGAAHRGHPRRHVQLDRRLRPDRPPRPRTRLPMSSPKTLVGNVRTLEERIAEAIRTPPVLIHEQGRCVPADRSGR